MWDIVTYADLKQAKQQLKLSRDEIAKRHAEELKGLDGERAELEALERLVIGFARKFKGGSPPSGAREPAGEAAAPEPDAKAAAPEPDAKAAEPEPDAKAAASEPAAEQPAAAPEPAPPPGATKPSNPRSAGRNGDERKYSQSNFDTFRRALSGRL